VVKALAVNEILLINGRKLREKISPRASEAEGYKATGDESEKMTSAQI
jgi:hypothetical protein